MTEQTVNIIVNNKKQEDVAAETTENDKASDMKLCIHDRGMKRIGDKKNNRYTHELTRL